MTQEEAQLRMQMMHAEARVKVLIVQIPMYERWVADLRASLPKHAPVDNDVVVPIHVQTCMMSAMVTVYAAQLESMCAGFKDELAQHHKFLDAAEKKVNSAGIVLPHLVPPSPGRKGGNN